MMFVYPLFLWALTAISIPIIIHLFNFRRYKKVYFTNVHFLKELQLESQSKSRLKELLILICRILTITLLALAFAQPVFVNKNNAVVNVNQKSISIYLDNSFSMEEVNKQGQLFESARRTAKEIVSSYGSNDRYHLITNDFEGKHQRYYTKEDMLNELNEIKISPVVRSFSDVHKRETEFLGSENKRSQFSYALSDVQKSSFNLEDIKNDSTTQITIVPLEANETNNLYIDSCWFESPIQQKGFLQKLNVLIQNKSQKTIDAGTARLMVNGNQTSIGSFSVEANSKKELAISFTIKNEGLNYASVKLDDYPITFDDELFFTFNSKLTINTVFVNGKESTTLPFFNSLFAADSLFNYVQLSENSIDYSKFKNADLIVLNEISEPSNGLISELSKFTQKGGNIVVIPSAKLNKELYSPFYSALGLPAISTLDTHALKLNKPDKNDPFFEGVFEKIDPQLNLPLSLQHYVQAKSSGQIIYSIQNGDPFLTRVNIQNASVYLFSSSLSEKQSNFCKHALFVPTFIRIAVTSLRPQPLFYKLNANNAIRLRSEGLTSEAPPHIVGHGSKMDMIPEMRVINNYMNLFVDKQLALAGFYDVVWQGSVKQNLAFNYDRLESNLIFSTLEELKDIISKNSLKNYSLIDHKNTSSVAKAIQLEANGTKLWKWCLLFSLLFIAIEICLIRFLK
ncbi:MAG: BatA and WFA domain-containing protein [Bacteroidia bacterium]|nr:BatA and WFA domain-containing protein [Bacteroidia bacterium]